MTTIGLAQSNQPDAHASQPHFPWGTEPLNKQAISVVVAYEKEWGSFFNTGLGLAGQTDIKAIGLSKQMGKYLAVSSSIESDAHMSDALRTTPMSKEDYARFADRLDYLRTTRNDILYQLITGPFGTRLPLDQVAEVFPPNKE